MYLARVYEYKPGSGIDVLVDFAVASVVLSRESTLAPSLPTMWLGRPCTNVIRFPSTRAGPPENLTFGSVTLPLEPTATLTNKYTNIDLFHLLKLNLKFFQNEQRNAIKTIFCII